MSISADHSPRLKFILAFASVYVIWGSTYLAIRFAVETLPPFLMAGVRFLVAGVALFLFMRSRTSERLTTQHWKTAFILGGLLLLGGNGLVSWAEKYVSSGLAATLVATSPLWIFFMEWLFLGAKLTVKNGAGIVFGMIGLLLLLNPFDEAGNADFIGSMTIVLAALLWAAGSIYSKRAPLPKSSFLSGAIQMICGGVLLIIVGLVVGETDQFSWSNVSEESLWALLYLIVFGSVVALSAFYWLLQNTSASKATTYAFVNPAVAVFLGWLLADEQVSASSFVALGLIVLAVILVLSSKPKMREPVSKAKTKPQDEDFSLPKPEDSPCASS